MPLTFEALKSQRYRWCFGGIQILRMHWRSLLPGPRTAQNRLTLGDLDRAAGADARAEPPAQARPGRLRW
jgi:hypothetical protein